MVQHRRHADAALPEAQPAPGKQMQTPAGLPSMATHHAFELLDWQTLRQRAWPPAAPTSAPDTGARDLPGSPFGTRAQTAGGPHQSVGATEGTVKGRVAGPVVPGNMQLPPHEPTLQPTPQVQPAQQDVAARPSPPAAAGQIATSASNSSADGGLASAPPQSAQTPVAQADTSPAEQRTIEIPSTRSVPAVPSVPWSIRVVLATGVLTAILLGAAMVHDLRQRRIAAHDAARTAEAPVVAPRTAVSPQATTAAGNGSLSTLGRGAAPGTGPRTTTAPGSIVAVWPEPTSRTGAPTCALLPGSDVLVLAMISEGGGSRSYNVQRGSCKGWVAARFLRVTVIEPSQ